MQQSVLRVQVQPHPEADLILSLIRYKQIPHEVLPDQPDTPVRLSDHQITLTATSAIVDYLCERWPCHRFCPREPVERAVYRQLLDQLQGRYYRQEQRDPPELSELQVPRTGFFGGREPNIVDFLVVPVMRRYQSLHPVLEDYVQRFDKEVEWVSSSSPWYFS